MKILCRHGHYSFFEERAGEIARYCNYFGIQLEREEDYFTFPFLVDAPRYSLAAKPYLGFPATETFEGRKPWDVFKQNGFVYNVALGSVVPKETIIGVIDPALVGDFWLVNNPMIQAGSRDLTGSQVLSFQGFYVQEFYQFRITEFSYE